MKTKIFHFGWRAAAIGTLVVIAGLGTSCMTTYDAYGNPVQSVDPAVAVAGAAAAGMVGYAIANDNDDHHHGHRYYGHGGYYRGGYYRHH